MKFYNFKVEGISEEMVKLLMKPCDEEGLEFIVEEVK
jgi:hypothetical protein